MKTYIELIKPRLSVTVIFSSFAGYLLASSQNDYLLLIKLMIGGLFLVGASNGLNQVYEVNTDALMTRTKERPLPSKRMSIMSALIFSLILGFTGLLLLFSINITCGFFGALSCFIYVFGYTPLKTSTPISGFIGAFPGAMPFMLGYVAVTNHFNLEAVILFAIQFLWQFPHFWSIAWIRYDDYNKANIKLLPSGEKDYKSAFQIVFYTFWLLPVSISPILLKYFDIKSAFNLSIPGSFIIFLLGLIFFTQSMILLKTMSNDDAKKLMFFSLIYLPFLQIIYIIDKFV